MSLITTHVLDTALGKPGAGIPVVLYDPQDPEREIGSGVTDEDGRIPELGPDALEPGTYALDFATGAYFDGTGRPVFYPSVTVTFRVGEDAHYHVPLLLSPFGYSTYRGS